MEGSRLQVCCSTLLAALWLRLYFAMDSALPWTALCHGSAATAAAVLQLWLLFVQNCGPLVLNVNAIRIAGPYLLEALCHSCGQACVGSIRPGNVVWPLFHVGWVYTYTCISVSVPKLAFQAGMPVSTAVALQMWSQGESDRGPAPPRKAIQRLFSWFGVSCR